LPFLCACHICVAGHRLSIVEMEEIVSSHLAVAECAVFGVYCDLKGQKPLGLLLLKSDEGIDHYRFEAEIVKAVRNEIGTVAPFEDVKVVLRLSKT
jgi:propionyl-CoA synthetase